MPNNCYKDHTPECIVLSQWIIQIALSIPDIIT